MVVSTNQLDGTMPRPYAGGAGRGETIFIQPGVQLDGGILSIYGGGIGRGEFMISLKNNQLDGNILNIYGGGIGRGEFITPLSNNQLDGNILSIYGGGIGRGETVMVMNTNQLDGDLPNLYGGGIGRGEHLFGTYTLQLDGFEAGSMYLGGGGRGETVQQTVNTALPVTLMSFGALLAGSQVKVQWQTASEQNSAFFLVEKSLDGSSWQPVGKVTAAGQSDKPLNYQLYDTQPVEGVNYYRLKPTDLDGQFTYSSVATVHYHTRPSATISVYPNPVAYEFTVALQVSQTATRLHLALVNAHGQTVFEKQNLNGNNQTFNIANLAAGIYYLVIDNNGAVTTTKIVKQ